jgi:amino acid adenylation domain-containing protein/non-ribosomal peptide synthase protein (TIGR01720 family)
VAASDKAAGVSFTYWTSSLSEWQGTNLSCTFAKVLQSLLKAGDQRVSDLDTLSGQDTMQILDWNNSVPAKKNACVHDIVASQMRARPEAPAICAWDGNFTYNELDMLSGRLAQHLVGLGVGPEIMVPLCFEKSAWAIVAMMAILKAGGACVSLDPSHPIKRIEGIIREVNTKLVLTAPITADKFERLVDKVLVIDRLFLTALPLPTSLPICTVVQPTNPAFVVYTSGSTGTPKGVVLEHASVCTSVEAHGSSLHLRQESRVLQFAAYVFDISIQDIFTTLMRGGCVCVPSEKDRVNDLAGAINKMEVNWACLTPTIASLLQPSDVPGLQTLTLAGEAVTKKVTDIWGGLKNLNNCYGPAESTIYCAWNGTVGKKGMPSNIGRGLSSLLWIVEPEDHHRLASVGLIGELLIEGPLLARGYLNDPAKTATNFIKNPNWAKGTDSVAERRMYKTGDLVRYNSDGTLDYLGRKDMQVKIHGQRLELGEIEHHIKLNLPSISHVAVDLVANGRSEGCTLAAFLCFTELYHVNSDSTLIQPMTATLQLDMIALEALLAKSLPSYMVPSLYVPLHHIPLNISGKTDRGRLKRIAEQFTLEELSLYGLAQAQKRAPSTDMEKRLQTLWGTVLCVPVESVGADDSFFRLGGDSIAAMRLVSVARQQGVLLMAADIFRMPMLAEMATVAVLSDRQRNKFDIPKPFALLADSASSDSLVNEMTTKYEIEKSAIQNLYPCTALQEGLMTLSNAQVGAYINQMVFRLPADLDFQRFRAAWETVVEITDILRLRIVYTETSGSLQMIVRGRIQWCTARALPEHLEADKKIPMEYGRSLMRYATVGEGSDECYFVWTAHHAAYDAWSISLLLEKVERVYDGREAYSYAPFSGFIKYLVNVDTDASDNFWRAQLAGTIPPTFPIALTALQGSRVGGTLTHEMELPRKMGSDVTISTVIRAAWAMVMARSSNSNDVVFGATLTGRNAAVLDINTIIGPTITTVPIRLRLNREQPVSDFLTDVQSQATSMIPFEHAGLQHIKKLSPDAHGACDFQNLLVVQPASDGDNEASTGPMGSQQSVGGGAGFHTYFLVLECILHHGRMSVIADFDERVISRSQMHRIVCQFEHVVRQLNDGNAKQLVGDVDLFTPQDKKHVQEWNSAEPKKIEACVHDIFAQQVSSRPDSAAVSAWDANFTYNEVDELSGRLANHLMSLGVGPEIMVPLCFEKSAWTIVAMLGVMRAGGACVPLDPSNPLGRIERIIQDVGAKILLAGPAAAKVVAPLAQRVLIITRSFLADLPVVGGETRTSVESTSAAFVIYTSGSTGTPKGVVLEHGAVCTSIQAHGSALRIGPRTRMLQFASYAFDISIHDIFTTLLRGGCVCVPSDHDRVNDLAGAINNMDANCACITPTVAGLLSPSDVPGLKTLTLAGEAVTKKVADTWANVESLNNCYGPAESTIYCAWNGLVGKAGMPSNIGRGLASLLWVVEPENHNRLTPVGCVGELLLEGPLLARGYLNDEEKTASAFIMDPAWVHDEGRGSGRRMYKTGDLVRYTLDGTLDYLGRKDTQVKLHGQRLELGEVEYHLLSDDDVQNAIVMMPSKGHCQEHLVAITVLHGFAPSLDGISEMAPQTAIDDGLTVVDNSKMGIAAIQMSRVREQLSAHLPSYMVPNIWIIVEAIPLNTSGKLDRAKLTRWVEELDEETYGRVVQVETEIATAPTTAMDRRLRDLIGRVLNLPLERVAVNRSFVSLGGDSITAMQVVSRGRAEGIAVKVQDILQSKTISQLALVAKAGGLSSISRKDEVDTVFDLSPAQQLYFQLSGQKANQFNQSFFLRLTRETRGQDMARAIEAVVRQHSMLRARFTQSNGRWNQVITKNVAESYRFRLHEVKTEHEITAILAAGQAGLDIKNGPVFQAEMFNVMGAGQLLFLVAHHLVIDLVSWRVILQNVEEILESGTLSSETPFPFQAWCKLQVEHAQQHLIPNKVLPFDVLPANYAYWGMSEQPNVYGDATANTFTIDEDTTTALLESCQDAFGTEPVEIFLATLLQAFNDTFDDRPTPTLFSEGHGREPWESEIDLSETVGWFTTMSPLYVPVTSGTDVVETIRRTKDTRRKLPGNGRPYFASRFLNEEGVKAFEGHSSMEVLFNYLGRYQQLEREDGLLRREALPETGASVLDIGIDVQRLALFEISVVLVHGVSQFSIIYNSHMQRQAGIRSWMHAWEQALMEAARRLPRMASERTLSDFPLLSLSYTGLDKLRTQRLPQIGVSSFAEIDDAYPCSPMQQGLLLSQTKNSGNYHITFMYEVVPLTPDAPVDVEKLLLAWQQVVDRHPALRTVFVNSVSEEGIFDQIVLKHFTPQTITKNCPESDAEVFAMLYDKQSILDHGEARPLHKLTVCRMVSGKVVYKLEINHAIIDAASMGIVQRDLALAYSGSLPAGPGPLYSHYIKYLGDRPNIAIDYWKGHLAGLAPCHFPLSEIATQEPRQLNSMTVDLNLATDALQIFCEKNGVTIANVMQTVWGLVLRCYTGSDQLCFGYLASGRDIAVAGIEDVIGPFINMLVCRVDVDGASDVHQLVEQIQANYLAGLGHQHCSLAQIEHALDLSGTPLFNTLMSIQRIPSPSSPSSGQASEEKQPVIAFKNIGSHDPTEVSDISSVADESKAN